MSLSENYTKRLQSWGRLAVGVETGMDHQDQNSSGGTILTPSEPHQLYLPTSPSYRPVYLSRPQVIDSTIVVSVGSDTLNPPGSVVPDYTVTSYGLLTRIDLVFPVTAHVQSLLLTGDNLSVTVTYQSESASTSSYDTFNASVQVRLDLFGRFGVYGRVNWLDNNAPPAALAQTLTDVVGGADYNQTFYHYPANGDQSQYQFIGRYNARLPMSITWYLEGGGTAQEVSGTDQLYGSARTGLSWSRGKLSLRVGYEFNTQSTASGGFTEERIKHRFFTYLRRSF